MNGMLSEIRGLKSLPKAYFIAIVLLVCSIVLNNAMNSICIILLLATWFIERNFSSKWSQLKKEPFFIMNGLLFLMYLISIGVSEDKLTAQHFLTKNLSLIIIPAILLSMPPLKTKYIYMLLKAFIACVFLQMAVESILALIQYAGTGDISNLFYHKLVENIEIGGAIIASFFCTLSVTFLFFLPGKGKWKIPLYIVFTGWIILLNSKMFLALLLSLFFLNAYRHLNLKARLMAISVIVLSTILIVITKNPIRQRFKDMNHFKRSYLTADTYDPSMYFDGLSLRLIYIRFGFQIIQERGNYFLGVGTGDAEHLLKEKIVSYNMYTGDGITEKEGYLKYGFHNEFLQKLIQLGISGFLIFIAILTYCIYLAIRHKHLLLGSILLIFIFSFFTDTLMEHQVGLVSFLVFTCLCIIDIKNKKNKQATDRTNNVDTYSTPI